MENNLNVTNLLFCKSCPFDYQCKAVDCMECMRIYVDGKGETVEGRTDAER